MSRRALAACLALLSAIALAVLAPRATATPPPGAPAFADAAGIHVVSAQQSDPRLWSLSVSTAALGRAVRLRVLLPADYAGTSTTYPVLYLFHGTSGGPDDWINDGDVETTTAGLPLIVVLPDAGFANDGGGWFTNWWDKSTALGPSNWQTFHVDQLIPFIDNSLRTIAARQGRAIAGLSQGGFGAYTYAAQDPDLFAAAASFSGAPDIASNPVVEAGATTIIAGTAVALDGVEPDAMFGPHLTNEINWQGRNPAALVTNLRGMNLSLYTATGIPGSLDTTFDPEASGIEFLSHISTLAFAQRAEAAHIPYYLDDYVFGTHSFPYWARDLRDLMPRLMNVFAHPAPLPTSVDYRSIETTWTQWGWTIANIRGTSVTWSELTGATAAGFTLSGRGAADVTTPAAYAPGSTHSVKVVGPAGTATSTLSADASGHLHITVQLHNVLQPSGTAKVTIS
jgi:S-formylglutathione hydrolase FrmB